MFVVVYFTYTSFFVIYSRFIVNKRFIIVLTDLSFITIPINTGPLKEDSFLGNGEMWSTMKTCTRERAGRLDNMHR